MGAWIEMDDLRAYYTHTPSHPTWVRGLKYDPFRVHHGSDMSHPTWVRGLKSLYFADAGKISQVAPHVGAWIEIPTSS